VKLIAPKSSKRDTSMKERGAQSEDICRQLQGVKDDSHAERRDGERHGEQERRLARPGGAADYRQLARMEAAEDVVHAAGFHADVVDDREGAGSFMRPPGASG
jgi:hypothetical protein